MRTQAETQVTPETSKAKYVNGDHFKATSVVMQNFARCSTKEGQGCGYILKVQTVFSPTWRLN